MSKTTSEEYSSVMITKSRLNGLKIMAQKEHRSASNLLDIILQKAGVKNASDEDLKEAQA